MGKKEIEEVIFCEDNPIRLHHEVKGDDIHFGIVLSKDRVRRWHKEGFETELLELSVNFQCLCKGVFFMTKEWIDEGNIPD